MRGVQDEVFLACPGGSGGLGGVAVDVGAGGGVVAVVETCPGGVVGAPAFFSWPGGVGGDVAVVLGGVVPAGGVGSAGVVFLA